MKKQITHVSVHQSSKVIATVYAILVFFVSLIMALITMFQEGSIFGGLFVLIVTPLFYWFVFYVGHVIVFYLYNYLVKYIGAVEVELNASSLETTAVNPVADSIHAVRPDELNGS